MTQSYQTFGSYVLFKELLVDDLGHLYRAGELDREGVKRTVFLRVFDGPAAPGPELVQRYETAEKVSQLLRSTNVVSNSVFLDEDGVQAMGWDYIPAQSLSRIFAMVHQEGFPVPVDNALLILEKISLALSAALTVELDGSSLVHGFLHPAMVVISNDGEGQVAGLGMAEELLGLIDDPAQAEPFVPYLAPEVLVTRTASKRGDVYSLGAILYQLLTSEPLPADPDARLDALASAELSYDGEPIPEDIMGVLSRALAVRPEERFTSAADFKKELDKLLYGGAYSPTTFNLALFMDRLFRDQIEEDERDVAVEAEIDATAYLRPEPEPEPEPEAAPPARGGGKGLWIGLAAGAAIAVAASFFMFKQQAPPEPLLVPTPTEEERIAAEEAKTQRMQALVDQEMQRIRAARAKEKEETEETIRDLQTRLAEAEKRAGENVESREDQRQREDLRRQLEAAKAEESRLQKEEAEQRAADIEREARERVLQQQAELATPVPQVTPPGQEAATAIPATPIPATAIPATPIPGPVLGRAATPTPAAQTQPASDVEVRVNMFFEPSDVDTLPKILRQQTPTWSHTAVASRRRGLVIIQVTVNARGRAEEISVLRADHEDLGIPESAMEAAKKSLFKPATKNGIKVKCNSTMTYRYNFRRR